MLSFFVNPITFSTNSYRYHRNEAFGYGERLDYKVRYGPLVAGEGFLHVLPKPTYRNGRECYNILFQVNSLKSLEWLYRIKNWYSSIVDVAGIFPFEFEQRIREGNYKRDFKAVFDQTNNFVYAEGKRYSIPPYVHDVISAFYYTRTLPLETFPKDTVFYLHNFFKDTTYRLGVKILGKQTVSVDAGKFRCIVVEPLVVEGGLFKSEGSIYIWLTDDKIKMPVKVATKIIIGYVTAELVSFRGVRGKIEAKLN
ncbi:MAG: DUF3108 domain-containing protein [Ignavibacteria bacterium]|nr:DUF3108 domain-containing protein [Ignavibacteria bacterium]